jgi:hypothetical protein
MKKSLLTLLIVLLVSCRTPSTTAIPHTTPRPSVWSVYDPDPDHPWNQVYRQLYRRTTKEGQEYGADELDPLLWFDTNYLLAGTSHLQTLRVLEEFLSTGAEDLIRDPLKRALFQRDLWAVFDWAAFQAEPYPRERDALKVRLVEIMKRVSLPKDEILSLPDHYALAVQSGMVPAVFQENSSGTAFLPVDLFRTESAWIPLGREGGAVAHTHTEAFPFFARSVFVVFVRSPDGREGTLEFIDSLNREPNPVTPVGSQVALVRRMLLIDDQGELVPSRLVETIQLRHFGPAQSFYEFELDRRKLFDGEAGGLVPNRDLFMLFMGHGDVFENPISEVQVAIPLICKACHFETSPSLHSGATQSIISYSREPFPLPGNARPVLFASTVEEEALTVIEWKRDHETWSSLKVLWTEAIP